MSNEENIVKEENKTIPFPIERAGSLRKLRFYFTVKLADIRLLNLWKKMKKDEKNKVIPLSLGPLVVYVCPNCYTLQLPEEVFKEILKKSTSNLIT